jgi:nucleotide-binding universal stress UspA family protein
MIKDLVVSLSVAPERDPAAEFALSVARAFSARVVGIAFQSDPITPTALVDSMPPPPDLIESLRMESERAAKAAAGRFNDAAQLASVPFETRIVTATVAGAANRFAEIARRFDLAVVAQAQADAVGPEALIVEQALFDSGRPVLVVPYIQTAPFKADRVMLCWDGSRPAARAAGDAMPILSRAQVVEVFTIASGKLKSDEFPGSDIAEHLAHHGLNVKVTRTVSGDVDVANVILSHAADSGANLIVMGGYGHSRLRELILGGATRGILTSMTVPTLMSH